MYKQPDSTNLSAQVVGDFDGATTAALLTSLTQLAQRYALAYLLSHHDDGVVWGRFVAGKWKLSAERFDVSPSFVSTTLQECRVFGNSAELLVWRNVDNHLQASLLIEDGSGDTYPYFEQKQLLWGDDQSASPQDGFTLLSEGSQGLCHAVPFAVNLKKKQRVALTVRHYIDYDNDQAYVKWSRLTTLGVIPVGTIGRSR